MRGCEPPLHIGSPDLTQDPAQQNYGWGDRAFLARCPDSGQSNLYAGSIYFKRKRTGTNRIFNRLTGIDKRLFATVSRHRPSPADAVLPRLSAWRRRPERLANPDSGSAVGYGHGGPIEIGLPGTLLDRTAGKAPGTDRPLAGSFIFGALDRGPDGSGELADQRQETIDPDVVHRQRKP